MSLTEQATIFFCVLLVIQLILPLIFALGPSSRHHGESKLAIARRELRGHIAAHLWVIGLMAIVTSFPIRSAIEKSHSSSSDTIMYVLFALFCLGILGFFIWMAVQTIAAKIRDVKAAREDKP